MRKWLLTFDIACGDLPFNPKGERFTLPSLTIQGDSIDLARAVKLMAHGELVPMKNLQYGVDSSDVDPIDMQAELQFQQFSVDQAKDQAKDQANDQANVRANDQANVRANDQANDQANAQANDQANV